MIMNLTQAQYISFTDVMGMGILIQRIVQKHKSRDINTCQIDKLIANNEWDTKYSLVSIQVCEKPMLKKVWFEKEFTPYLTFIVYDFESILALLNEHTTEGLTDLSRHTLVTVAIHNTMGEEPVYLVD